MAWGFTNEQKEKIMDKAFGENKTLMDFAGRRVARENAVIDHIIPLAKGGKSNFKNAQVVHPKTKLEKGNKLSGNIGPSTSPKVFRVNQNPDNPYITVRDK